VGQFNVENEVTDMKYTESHEWIVMEKEVGTVGISHFAQKELGEVVYLELPFVGKKIKAGDEIAVLESTKAAADIYSPVSGEIIAVNQALKEGLHLLNQSPETEGWLFKIKTTVPEELQQLLEKDAYLAMISATDKQ
jgi:glycine cleavage system H protein